MRAGWDEWIIVLISRPGETKQRKPFTMHYRDNRVNKTLDEIWHFGNFLVFSCVSELFIWFAKNGDKVAWYIERYTGYV